MKSHRTRSAGILAALALGAAALVGSATAQVNEDGVRKAFAQADVNKDGYVNVDEYVAAVVVIFRQADRNGDRMISIEEAAAFTPTHTPEAFRKAARMPSGAGSR